MSVGENDANLTERAQEAISEYLKQIGVFVKSSSAITSVEGVAKYLSGSVPKSGMVMFGDKSIIALDNDLIQSPDKKRRYFYYVINRLRERYRRDDVTCVFDFVPVRFNRYSVSDRVRNFKLTICPVNETALKRAEQMLILELMGPGAS